MFKPASGQTERITDWFVLRIYDFLPGTQILLLFDCVIPHYLDMLGFLSCSYQCKGTINAINTQPEHSLDLCLARWITGNSLEEIRTETEQAAAFTKYSLILLIDWFLCQSFCWTSFTSEGCVQMKRTKVKQFEFYTSPPSNVATFI